MNGPSSLPRVSRPAFWIGWVLSVLPVLMLLFSAYMKFALPKEAVEGFEHLQYPTTLAFNLGILELACAAIYLFPHTAVLGAILLTGYFGGATATHVRVHDPFWIPPLLGVLVWLGLYLREPRLRSLIPLRR